MYVLHRRQRAMTVSATTGTSACKVEVTSVWRILKVQAKSTLTSPGFKERYGVMTSARGSFDFCRSELVVGIALIVERWYDGSELRVSLCEKDAWRDVHECVV